MRRHLFLTLVIFLFAGLTCFGQAGALRDYVGLISIRYHPDVVTYMGKFRESFEKKGFTSAAKSIDNYLKGLSGSGFIYVAADGTNYVLTNEHVITQSDSLSITFEKLDGAKTTYERLRVLYADEEKDLALLVFDEGVKPFTRGLSFGNTLPDEGGDVFAAGFPGLGNAAIWQFSRGTVSNAAARIPKSSDSDETIGPYIQHTAQIDPGNSGGPLLISAQGVPANYAVVGINTMSAYRRQAANYAIPITQVQVFIDAALSKAPVNEQELIAKKIDNFLKGIKTNKNNYDHIADFLSNNCTASNAEYSISELLAKAPQSVLKDIDDTFSNNPVEGMNAAVAWNIDNTMRSKSGTIKITLDSITANNKGGFDVAFNVNDAIVKSEWVKEYGIYRMDTYGDYISGNKALLVEKEKAKQQDKKLKTNYVFSVSAGYAHLIGYKHNVNTPALNAALRIYFPSYVSMGLDSYFDFSDYKFLQIGMVLGYMYPIRLNSFALMPLIEGSAGIIKINQISKNEIDFFHSDFDFIVNFNINAKAGMIFTFAKAPGLFGRVFYQYNFPLGLFSNTPIRNHSLIGIGIGYGI